MMQANIISAEWILNSRDLFRAADADSEQEVNITMKHISISEESLVLYIYMLFDLIAYH